MQMEIQMRCTQVAAVQGRFWSYGKDELMYECTLTGVVNHRHVEVVLVLAEPIAFDAEATVTVKVGDP